VSDGQLRALVSGDTRAFGWLPSRPRVVNPLDHFVGLERRLRRLRLKEWIGFTLIHPELYASMVIQDAHYLASSEIYAYDSGSHALQQHASNALGGSLRMPDELSGRECVYARPGYEIRYEFGAEAGGHRIVLQIAASRRAQAIRGELTLDAGAASMPLSVSSRLPGGALYTHKRLFPASGAIRVGATEFVFDPSRDLAILDEHKSFLPYRTRWLWGTFARIAAEGPVGANFVSRPELPGQPRESCVWTPGTVEPLDELSFAPESTDPLSPWHIWSSDGLLDVRFEPDGRKQVKHQLLLAAIDYFQLFGRYTGTIIGTDRTYSVRDVHGVCESMLARL
jgi:hypothetical protein